jgi:hypothetical protein
MTATALTSRKVLLPLATLLAAGAVAVGSGATWTSSTDSDVSVTGGLLSQFNDRDGATLTLTDIKPGDSMTGTVVVENTGDVDSTLDLAVSGVTSTFSDYLTITVKENGVTLYNDLPLNDLEADFDQTDIDFPAADDAATAGVVEDKVTYVITVTLSSVTTDVNGDTVVDALDANFDQEKSAGATFTWTQTQTSGGTILPDWVS